MKIAPWLGEKEERKKISDAEGARGGKTSKVKKWVGGRRWRSGACVKLQAPKRIPIFSKRPEEFSCAYVKLIYVFSFFLRAFAPQQPIDSCAAEGSSFCPCRYVTPARPFLCETITFPLSRDAPRFLKSWWSDPFSSSLSDRQLLLFLARCTMTSSRRCC